MRRRGDQVQVRAGRQVTDAVEARAVVEEAFGEVEGRSINSLLTELDARGLSQHFFVASSPESESKLIGVVGLSRAWLDTRQELVEVLLLSPLAVISEHRGAGVGAALLKACVSYGNDVGAPMIVLEGDPGYYAPHGWIEAATVWLERPSVRIPSPACQVRLLRAHEKWMTGRLVYPDTWWRHDSVGLRDPLLAEVEEQFRN